jgi:monoterpene epsilon-lactone hydrolase
MEGWREEEPLPGYARVIDVRGGALRRWWLHTMLRLSIRRAPAIDADLERMRVRWGVMDARFGRIHAGAVRTPVDCDGVTAEWIEVPERRGNRVLLYFHGGAFLFRFPHLHAGMAADFCARIGARALMVDYRLAPEHPYPAAVDDCHAAYRWLLAQGVAARDIVLGGDSAGGNLVLTTLHRVKAAGEPMPACAVLLSPVVDFTLSSRSLVVNERRDPMFTLATMIALRSLYAPPERYLEPGVSPLFADFAGFPPLLFQAGGIEGLRDESLRAAARAQAAGVTVQVEVWARMGHVFQAVRSLPQAGAAAAHIADFIRRHAGWM